VERVIGVNQGKKESNIEFVAELSRIYRKAGLNVEFRWATSQEYDWADTAGGTAPKTQHDPHLWKATPYREISNRDPDDLTKPSPSKEDQPRSIWKNAPNAFGFRRSGVWERLEYKDGQKGYLAGGGWDSISSAVVSGNRPLLWVDSQAGDIGSSRLVKIQK
jgi:hypothetical protein